MGTRTPIQATRPSALLPPLTHRKAPRKPSYSGLAFIVNRITQKYGIHACNLQKQHCCIEIPQKLGNGGFYRMSTGRNPVNNLKTKSKGNPFRNATNTRKEKSEQQSIRRADLIRPGLTFSFRTSLSTTPAANNPPKPKPTTIIKF